MVRENDFLKTKKQEPSTSETAAKSDMEIKEKRYRKIGETFAMIVTEILNLSVPEKTIEEWKVLSSSMGVIDKRLDNIVDPMERLKFTQKIIDFLKGDMADFSTDKDVEKSMLDVKNLIASLEENQRESFVNSLSSILKITEKIKTEKNSKKLVELTRIEGQLAARFYLLFLPQEFKLSEKYRQLVLTFTRLGRAANSFDSFVDLPGDYNNKEVQVPPTTLNRTLFLGAVLSDGLSVMKNIGLSKNIIKRFFQATKHVAQDVPQKSK